MELTQLRYFAAVAELQHVTRAAERMHVAQPAITKSIHRLEDELGIPLVASRGRNIVLTDYGLSLIHIYTWIFIHSLYDPRQRPLVNLRFFPQNLH